MFFNYVLYYKSKALTNLDTNTHTLVTISSQLLNVETRNLVKEFLLSRRYLLRKEFYKPFHKREKSEDKQPTFLTVKGRQS